MSKRSEEAALKAYPERREGDSRGSYDSNSLSRAIYRQAYEQAEKELLNRLEVIEREYKDMSHNAESRENYIYASALREATTRIIRLVKDDEDVQPEHSRIESVYQCGKKPHWNVDDTLAYYGFYSDREGECVLGKVTKVEFDEEQCDWFYTFEDGRLSDEQSLLEDQTYKKN